MNAFPGLNDRINPPHKVAILVDLLAEEGVPAGQVLAGSGISGGAVLDPATRISVRQLLAVFRNALRLSRDPAIALRAGKRIRITHFGLYGYALLSSPTPMHAIDFALKYRALTAPAIGLSFERRRNTAVWSFADILGLDEELLRFVLEFQLATQLSLHRDVLGTSLEPLEILVTHAAPSHAGSYGELLGRTPRFGQAVSELRFDARWLDQKLAYGNPITAALAGETCDRLLAELRAQSGMAGQVWAILLEHPGRFPDMEDVSQRLNVTSRTLRRKLMAEGTSYQKLLSDVRRQLAIDYLQRTRMSVDDIAASLGFSDAANFRHAFKRWTRKQPSSFRTREAHPADQD